MFLQVVKGEELLDKAKEKVTQALRYPEAGRAATKAAYRAEFSQQWIDFSKTEPGMAWKTLAGDETVGVLRAYLEKLKGKRSKL